MDDPSSAPHGPNRPAARFPWIFLTLVTLLIAAFIGARWYTEYEPGTGNLSSYAAAALLILVVTIWIACRRSLPPIVRFCPLAILFVGTTAFFSYYRLAGWSSALHPLFEPRWTSRELPALAQAAGGRDITKVASVSTTPFDFPGFLGPNRDQTITAVRLERDWQKNEPELIWRQPIGEGWSGFAVVADYAITQEQRDDQEMIVCYELGTGKVRWAHGDPVRFGSTRSFGGLGPRATPTIHNSRVFTLGATGVLNCLELATGRLLWSKDIHAENDSENPFWGTACSPLVVDDLVVVSAGGVDNKSLVAYRQEDGKREWSGGSDGAAYASPSLDTLCGIRQILMVNEDWVAGHDAANGRVLWRFSWPGKSADQGNASQARVVDEDQVFVSKGYTTGAALYQFDSEKLRRAQATGQPTEPTLVWNKLTTKKALLKTKHSNVCIRDGYAYGLDEDILQCVELATGKQRWKRGRYGQGQLLLIDDLLLVQAEDGRVVLVEANPEEHVELASFQALEDQPCWNCPALAGPYLIVRNKYEAACYKLPVVE
ncbi:MAG: PQQ-binding-like beta-propeller repeat protein [Pirellulales bacterium]